MQITFTECATNRKFVSKHRGYDSLRAVALAVKKHWGSDAKWRSSADNRQLGQVMRYLGNGTSTSVTGLLKLTIDP